MSDFFKKIENVFFDIWNYLYRFICNHTDNEPNKDCLVVNPECETE